MTEAELRAAVPERAPVIDENIETEFRTASGIVDDKGNKIFGVVIITAGYEADGKYTHFFSTQADISIGNVKLDSNDYIFGYKRMDAETLRVTFYYAKNGMQVGSIEAKVEKKKGPIYSFLITPPTNKIGTIHIGRFVLNYTF